MTALLTLLEVGSHRSPRSAREDPPGGGGSKMSLLVKAHGYGRLMPGRVAAAVGRTVGAARIDVLGHDVKGCESGCELAGNADTSRTGRKLSPRKSGRDGTVRRGR